MPYKVWAARGRRRKLVCIEQDAARVSGDDSYYKIVIRYLEGGYTTVKVSGGI